MAERLADDVARRRFDEALAGALPAGDRKWPVDAARRHQALMGAVMRTLRGRAPGRQVSRWLHESLGEARS